MEFLDVDSSIVQQGSLRSIKIKSLSANELKLPQIADNKLILNTASGLIGVNQYTAGTNISINGSNVITNTLQYTAGAGININGSNVISNTAMIPTDFIYVNEKSDLPTPSGGVITLLANYTYYFTTTVDLTGDRLVCGDNTVILGASSENSRIKSTGLVSALITSNYSLPMRNITLEGAIALDLNGNSSATTALDWDGVNLTSCASCGTIQNYSNTTFFNMAFLNSGSLTIQGTIGTVAFNQCLFQTTAPNTAIIIPSGAIITRRFRVIYSSFIIGSGVNGINVSSSSTIPDESYILDTVNFSGAGTYLVGLTQTSNKALFSNCKGITNTAVNGQMYSQSNAIATPLTINVFTKIQALTLPSADNSKFKSMTTGNITFISFSALGLATVNTPDVSLLTIGDLIYFTGTGSAIDGTYQTITFIGVGSFQTTSPTSVFVGFSGTWNLNSNRLICDAVISRKFLLQCTLSFTSGANNVCEFGFYDSTLGTVRTPSKTKATANASGRAENVGLICATTLQQGNYIEIWGRNTSAGTSITADAINCIITEIS